MPRSTPAPIAAFAQAGVHAKLTYLKVVESMTETTSKRRSTAKRSTAKAKRPPAPAKAVATRKPSAARRQHTARGERRDAAIDRTTELSDDVLGSLDESARRAVEAVRKFAEDVDRVLPPRGEGPSRRGEITDSALEMAQRLIHTQAEFLRKVVDSAGKSLTS